MAMPSCASIEKRGEKRGFDDGVLFSTIQTYELLVMENYDLLKLMDEEGDTGPSRRRNLVVARLNSALAHLGGVIKGLEGRKDWPKSVLEQVRKEEYIANNHSFARALKAQWESKWKASFDDEDREGFRELALERYIKFGNAFGLEKLVPRRFQTEIANHGEHPIGRGAFRGEVIPDEGAVGSGQEDKRLKITEGNLPAT